MAQFYMEKQWRFLRRKLPAGIHVAAEIGSYAGCWAAGFLSSFETARLYCVDPWSSDYPWVNPKRMRWAHRSWKKRTEPFGDRVIPVRMESVEAVGHVPDALDLVYVDGNHFDAYRDMVAWWPKLRVGGLMTIHDAAFEAVARDIVRFFGEGVQQELIGPGRVKIPTAWVIKEHE